MMFFTIIWNAISGNLGGIVSAIVGYLGKMSDNDTTKLVAAIGADKQVAVSQLQTSAQMYHDRVDLYKGMWVIQWLIAAATIPAIYHMGGVFMDSCQTIFGFYHPVGSWRFIALPKPYDEYEWKIIASLLGISTSLTVGLGFAKALMRR